MTAGPLAVVETHPIQYHAPVYRALARSGVPVTVIYGSDFSLAGYRDEEFRTTIAWDTDLLSGYASTFLNRVVCGGPRTAERVTPRGLAGALREARPAAVLLVGYGHRLHRAAFRQARRLGSPILFRGETTDHARRRAPWAAWARDLGLRWFYRQCETCLYIGRRSQAHYQRLGCSEDRLVFSPYAVDLAPFQRDEAARARLREAARQALGVTGDEPLLLFVGKLSARKGPDLLLEAARARRHAAGTPVVAFVGDGPMALALGRRARDAGIVAHRLGFRNQTQLSPFYHAADLLILPSRTGETWGLVVNEALHHGVPCVVSEAVGCAPDLIRPGVTGEVCEAESVPSLTAALERAWPLMGRPDVRAACRAQVSGYTVEHAAEGIARAFRAVTAGGAP